MRAALATASRYTSRPRTRPKGYLDSWQPRPDTIALLNAVIGVLNEYLAHLPLTVRQIFYRLIGLGHYEKTERFYERLCEAVSKGRGGRLISFDAIRDDGVSVLRSTGYDGVDGFLTTMRRQAQAYTRDKLVNQPVYLEVLCEAAGMQPQL